MTDGGRDNPHGPRTQSQYQYGHPLLVVIFGFAMMFDQVSHPAPCNGPHESQPVLLILAQRFVERLPGLSEQTFAVSKGTSQTGE
jgi:hypothetical protein